MYVELYVGALNIIYYVQTDTLCCFACFQVCTRAGAGHKTISTVVHNIICMYTHSCTFLNYQCTRIKSGEDGQLNIIHLHTILPDC